MHEDVVAPVVYTSSTMNTVPRPGNTRGSLGLKAPITFHCLSSRESLVCDTLKFWRSSHRHTRPPVHVAKAAAILWA